MTAVEQLKAFSARIGADMTLAQGAGGNTSLKTNDTLTVKASGKRLEDALREEIFVSGSLAQARAGEMAAQGALRPSIETLLHAILPFRVVAHLHQVDVMAQSLRRDAAERLAVALKGLNWAFVPYVRPGAPLAAAVADAARGGANIFVLANHGLLFGGDDFDECEALLVEIIARLGVCPRSATVDRAALDTAARQTGLVPARHDEAHWAALHPDNLRAATAGTLYPDHVVFLGRGAAVLDTLASPPTDGPSALFLAPGLGAFLRPDANATAHEMAACLGLVAARVAANAPLSTLTTVQEDELLNWDAEKYRQNLAQA